MSYNNFVFDTGCSWSQQKGLRAHADNTRTTTYIVSTYTGFGCTGWAHTHTLIYSQTRTLYTHFLLHTLSLKHTHTPHHHQAGGGAGEGVEVALDPSELDLDAATMTARCVCVREREGGREGGGGGGGGGREGGREGEMKMSLIRYEEQLKETKLQKEDLSDMVAEHAAKQKV